MEFLNNRIIPFPLPGSAMSRKAGQLSHAKKNLIKKHHASINVDEFLGLHFNLGKEISYSAHGTLGEIGPCQYNFIYLSGSVVDITIQQGIYESLQIEFPVEYIENLAELFPILNRLIRQVKCKRPVSISTSFIKCKAEMLSNIEFLLKNDFTVQGARHAVMKEYIWGKVFDILMLCLSDLTKNANQLISNEADRRKTEQARQYLVDHLKERFSADRIAEKVGMEKHKLRVAFKIMYNCTMQDFLIDIRLEKARSLLLTTDLSVERIGMAIGIKKLSNFSDFFKKKYGYSPRALRESILKKKGEK